MPDGSSRRFPSPLRYPGGKGKIANYIKLLFLRNGLVGYDYVEPYAGGAGVALSLLYEEYASHIHINDLDRRVFAFWHAVLNEPDVLCQRIATTEVTMEEWECQKKVQEDLDADRLDLAFSTFFLNRTNRSGIIDGGVIGGKDQDGTWKLDARYNGGDLIRRIQKVARYRNRITLSQMDAADYIRDVTTELSRQTFTYLDPPYYVKGKGLYENSYRDEDHAEIANLVSGLMRPWVVSYDAAPRILELYEGFDQTAYSLSYSAAERYRGAEVMFFSPDLELPDVQSPANIRVDVIDRTRRAEAALF